MASPPSSSFAVAISETSAALLHFQSRKRAALRSRRRRHYQRRRSPPTAFAMAPKPGKGKAAKAVKLTEAQRLEALRKERATFLPELSAKDLREWYYLFWSTETRAHPRTKVLSAVASQAAPVGGYPFFAVDDSWHSQPPAILARWGPGAVCFLLLLSLPVMSWEHFIRGATSYFCNITLS